MKILYWGSSRNIPNDFTGKFIYSEHEYGFYVNGRLHNEDGPAHIYYSQVSYYRHGLIHRIGGPAVIGRKPISYQNMSKEYYIFGKEVTKEQHDLLVLMLKLKEIKI